MKPEQLIDESQPVACQVSAIPASERDRWMEVGEAFYAQIDQVRELANGYALRAGREVSLQLVAEYVSRDRLCCAFLQWEIVVTQAGGPIWLYLRGPEGTKEFLRRAMEESTLLPRAVAEAAGLSTSSRAGVTLDNVSDLAERLGRPGPE